MNCYYCGKPMDVVASGVPLVPAPDRPACSSCLGDAVEELNKKKRVVDFDRAESEKQAKLDGITLAFNGAQIQELQRIVIDAMIALAPACDDDRTGYSSTYRTETCWGCRAKVTNEQYGHMQPKVLEHRTDCTYQAAERWHTMLREQVASAAGVPMGPDQRSRRYSTAAGVYRIPATFYDELRRRD